MDSRSTKPSDDDSEITIDSNVEKGIVLISSVNESILRLSFRLNRIKARHALRQSKEGYNDNMTLLLTIHYNNEPTYDNNRHDPIIM